MPIIRCAGCGRTTNSATCNWTGRDHHYVPIMCWVAWDKEGNPVRGCGYNKLSDSAKDWWDKYISDLKEKRISIPLKK